MGVFDTLALLADGKISRGAIDDLIKARHVAENAARKVTQPGWVNAPSVPSTSSVPSASAVNSTYSAPQERQATVTADNSVLPIIYGRSLVGGMIFAIATTDYFMRVGVAWCLGEIEEIESVYINDLSSDVISEWYAQDVSGQFNITHYLGSTSQTANSGLSTSISGYADTLVGSQSGVSYGVAYTVFDIPVGLSPEFPKFTAIIKGRKVYDPRTSTTVYSDNPALHLADFINSPLFGANKNLDWTSVETVADSCDEVMDDTFPRRFAGIVLDKTVSVANWVETLRTYAGCIVDLSGSTVKLIDDRPTTVSRSLTASDFPKSSSFSLSKRSLRQAPTVVRIVYTDTSSIPWRDREAVAMLDGVLEGTTPRREQRIALQGIQNHAQAYREAVERLNKLNGNDLLASWITYDDGVKDQIGDVVSITHPLGLTDKEFRITSIEILSPGRYGVSAQEYSDEIYSDSVLAVDDIPDSNLLDPTQPIDVTGLTLTENLHQKNNGNFYSTISIEWDVSDWPFVAGYEVQVTQGGFLIWSGSTISNSMTTSPVTELINYTVKVAIKSTTGHVGDYVQENITIEGKYAIPSDVTGFRSIEVGGEVSLFWTPVSDADIWRYEIRYGDTSSTWDTATVIEIIDGIQFKTRNIPPGDWKFFIKAIDSIKQYSENEAETTQSVTLDNSVFFIGEYELTYNSGASSYIHEIVLFDGTTTYCTDSGDTIATTYTSAISVYTSTFYSYSDSATPVFETDYCDFGDEFTGIWQLDVSGLVNTSGTTTVSFYISDDASTWVVQSGYSANTTGRYAKVVIEGGTFHINSPITVRLDVLTKEEQGTYTTVASSYMDTVYLDRPYKMTKGIALALGTGVVGGQVAYDNILLEKPSDFDPLEQVLEFYTYYTSGTGTNKYSYYYIQDWRWSDTYTVASGDKLCYEVWHKKPNTSSFIDFHFDTDGDNDDTDVGGEATLRGTPSINVDQNSHPRYYAFTPGEWHYREFDLTPVAGWRISRVLAANENNDTSDRKSWYRRIVIRDSADNIVREIYNDGSSHTTFLGTNAYSAYKASTLEETYNKCSFDIYTFNSSGAQAAGTGTWIFKGV
jgi:hypothetical protein